MHIISHMLPQAKQKLCLKNRRKFNIGALDTIVIHYTAGRDAESSAKHLCQDHVKASAHIIMDKEGSIIQMVPFDTIAWHAGKSEHNGRKNLNNYSIGIEIDNAGLLTKTEGGYRTWFGSKVDDNDVLYAKHRNESNKRYWQTYTEAQIVSCSEICEALIKTYDIKYILGHEEISPGRKTDPGPAFPLDKMREELMYNDREEEGGVFDSLNGEVTADLLNIRSGPSLDNETVSEPLRKDTFVIILDEKNGWYHVKAPLEGWVYKDYIK